MSAAKLYVYLKGESSNFLAYNPYVVAKLEDKAGSSSSKEVEMTKEVKYGEIWYSCDLEGYTKATILRKNPNNHSEIWNDLGAISSLSTTDNTYGELWYDSSQGKYGVWTGTSKRPRTAWSGLCIRSSKEGWSNIDSNTTKDGDTFTKVYTKAEVTSVISAGNNFYFRFRHVDAIEYDETEAKRNNEYTQIQVENDTELPFGTSTTGTHKQDWQNDGKSWYFVVPSYDFEKIVLTAQYVNESGYKWKISADAYISKTVVNNDYSTLGCSVPLDITSLPSGVKAYTLSTTGITINKVEKTTTLLADKGVLLENTSGENKTLSIPVAASGTADANNQLVAFTGSGKLTQPTSGNSTYYILTDMNSKVGFYKVNSTYGNSMGANTAYLVVSGELTTARDFFALDGETTGIANVDVNDNFDANAPMYNLAGQRVSKNYKGVVIVNGKKMLNK